MEGEKKNQTPHSENVSSASGGCVRGCPLWACHCCLSCSSAFPACCTLGHRISPQPWLVMTKPHSHKRDASAQRSRVQDLIYAWGSILTYVGLKGVIDTHHSWKGNGVRISALSLSCVTLEMLIDLFEPRFLHLRNKITLGPSGCFTRINTINQNCAYKGYRKFLGMLYKYYFLVYMPHCVAY